MNDTRNYDDQTVLNQLIRDKKIEQDYEVKRIFNQYSGKVERQKVPIQDQYRIDCKNCGNKSWGKIDFLRNYKHLSGKKYRFVYA